MLCRLFSVARRRHWPKTFDARRLTSASRAMFWRRRSAADRRHWPSTFDARRLRSVSKARRRFSARSRASASHKDQAFAARLCSRRLINRSAFARATRRRAVASAHERQAWVTRPFRHRRSTMKQKDAPLRRALETIFIRYNVSFRSRAAAALCSSESSSSWAHRTASWRRRSRARASSWSRFAASKSPSAPSRSLANLSSSSARATCKATASASDRSSSWMRSALSTAMAVASSAASFAAPVSARASSNSL
mmetsp:Transcript_6673/g.18724  ORF Transcript_6673/g.18724 Transcript_6673/m.18724 type:complete len:252 (+) Transcript_6673:551-1306(+)